MQYDSYLIDYEGSFCANFNYKYVKEEDFICIYNFPITILQLILLFINTLADTGFIVERMIEQTDEKTLQLKDEVDDRSRKAQKLPLSFVFKVRKA